jgi:hypothetical protein
MTSGMAFDNSKTMINKFTYKELTLLLGILVALIIVFALWIRQPKSGASTFGIKRPSVVEVIKNSVVKAYVNVAGERLSDQSNLDLN